LKPALVVVDMINDFVYGSLKVERAKRIIPNIKKLLEWARREKIPVIYACDYHREEDGEFKLWPKHAVAGSWGAQVINELKPEKGDYIVFKRRYSAFYSTDLDLLLRELSIDTLIIVGLVTNVCIQHTVCDAFFRGYKTLVPEDCVEALSEEIHRQALEYMKSIYGCEITTSSKIIGELKVE